MTHINYLYLKIKHKLKIFSHSNRLKVMILNLSNNNYRKAANMYVRPEQNL